MLLIGFWLCVTVQTSADDWPMLGRDGSRNSVSPEKNPPTVWSVEQRDKDRLNPAASGVRWSMPLGSETYSSPVIAGGFVWIGTNDNKGSLSGAMPNSVTSMYENFEQQHGDADPNNAEFESVLATYIRACKTGATPDRKLLLTQYPKYVAELTQ